jgi:uncharacterized protein DUF4440
MSRHFQLLHFSEFLFFVSFVVSGFLTGCAGAPQHPTWKNATGGEMHERLMWRAIRDKDWKNFEQHLAPAFVGVDPGGNRYDRAGWVEHWKSSNVGEVSIGDISVQPEGADMVITYLLNLPPAPTSASGIIGSMRVISVWQEVKSRWILTASTMTPVRGD